MAFRITGLPIEDFSAFFTLSDVDLSAHRGVRRVASGGEPCRVSLTDAQPGDNLILVNYEHLPVASPYCMRYAVFVRRGEKRFDRLNAISEQLRYRMLAVRSFDADGMNVEHTLTAGATLEEAIEHLLTSPAASYLHVHYASAGCYAARVDRA